MFTCKEKERNILKFILVSLRNNNWNEKERTEPYGMDGQRKMEQKYAYKYAYVFLSKDFNWIK